VLPELGRPSALVVALDGKPAALLAWAAAGYAIKDGDLWIH